MEPAERQSLEQLIEAYLEDALGAAEAKELSRRLRSDAEARRIYWQRAESHAALKLWGEQQAGRPDLKKELAGVTSARRWQAWWPVMAAAASLVLGLLLWRGVRVDDAALLTYTQAAQWETNRPALNGHMVCGEYVLRAGQVRFETRAGAVVSVTAPARFRIVRKDLLELVSGRLTARMLSDEARLTVVSGDTSVTDLGTAFGMETDASGRTLVSVFDGAVEVRQTKAGGQALRLGEGQSVVARRQVAALSATAYDPGAFRDLWPLTVGVNAASSLVEFLPPGPLLRPLREYGADDRLFLLPEKQKTVIDRRVAIDLAVDAPVWPASEVSPYPLESGTRVSSYLLFFQPESGGAGLRQLKGQVPFQQRVLGIICSDLGLDASDLALGLDQADYRTPGQRRGLEEADKENYRGAHLPHDSIRISPDGRTVHFDFHVSNEREQMRILVAEESIYTDL